MNELIEVLRGMADMLDGPQNAGNLVVPAIINRLRDASNVIERLETENTALRMQRPIQLEGSAAQNFISATEICELRNENSALYLQLNKVKKQAGLWKKRFKLEERAGDALIEELLNVTAERNSAIAALKAQEHLEPYAEADQKGRLHILPPENSVAQCLDFAKQIIDMGLTIQQALDMLRARQEQPNEPLTLEELRETARDGGYVWCVDMDGTHPGLLCYAECVLDDGKEAHIWLLGNEGNVGRYNVRYMIEQGASFYHRKPEQEE